MGKSAGIDEIPVEVFENDSAINILHRLFSIYFSTGFIPYDWIFSIISLIPESSTSDICNTDFALACHNIYFDVLYMKFEIWVTEKIAFYVLNQTDLEN